MHLACYENGMIISKRKKNSFFFGCPDIWFPWSIGQRTRAQNPKHMLLHNNENCHWLAIEHPSYEPYLSHCDFHIFGALNKELVEKRLQTEQQIHKFVSNRMMTCPVSFFHNGLKKLPICWHKCIEEKWRFMSKNNAMQFLFFDLETNGNENCRLLRTYYNKV